MVAASFSDRFADEREHAGQWIRLTMGVTAIISVSATLGE